MAADKAAEVEALRKIRRGLFWVLIGFAVLFFASLAYILLLASGVEVAFGALGLVGGVLTLLGIFIGVRGGFKELAEIDERFVISRRGTDMMLVGLVLLIASFAIFASGPAPGVGIIAALLVVIAIIMSIIGSILTFIVGSFRLDGRYGDKGYVTAAVLYIIGIFIPFLSIIAAYMLYKTLGYTISRLSA